MLVKTVLAEVFTNWLKTKTIKFVENLPVLVHKVCCAQFNKNMLNSREEP